MPGFIWGRKSAIMLYTLLKAIAAHHIILKTLRQDNGNTIKFDEISLLSPT
ncbi:MAG: hypothetical protein AAGG51_05595 [Cyanobacteria bacterium P01_G01_bin.54]